MFKLIAIIAIIIGLMSFSVYCYNVRNDHNVDKMKKQVEVLKYEVSVMNYALSIVPEDIKSEIYLNSIKEKFSGVEDKKDLFTRLGGKVEEEDKEEEDVVANVGDKEGLNPSKAMNKMLDGMN